MCLFNVLNHKLLFVALYAFLDWYFYFYNEMRLSYLLFKNESPVEKGPKFGALKKTNQWWPIDWFLFPIPETRQLIVFFTAPETSPSQITMLDRYDSLVVFPIRYLNEGIDMCFIWNWFCILYSPFRTCLHLIWHWICIKN